MNPELEEQRAAELIADLERQGDAACAGCGAPLGGHAWVASVALGFRNAPRCAACLADVHGRDRAGFLADLGRYIRGRACYRAAWAWASRHEGYGPEAQPGQLWLEEHAR